MSESSRGGKPDSSTNSDDKKFPCPTCDKEFDTEGGMKIHHTQTHNESISGVLCNCSNCDKEIRKQRSRVENSEYIYCSRECMYSHDGRGELIGNGLLKRINVECDWCGNGLERIPWRVQRSENHFCDIECKAKHHEEHRSGDWSWKFNSQSVDCSQCGKEMLRNKARFDRSKHQFCGMVCHGEWKSENLSGRNSHQWKGGHVEYYGPNWRDQREKARVRDQSRCQSCGSTPIQEGEELSVHHIRRLHWFKQNYGEPEWYEKGNSLDNLVCLCRSCHSRWEDIPLKPQLIK